MTKPRDFPASVYRHYAADGLLLYVGCSANPMARFDNHRTQSAWGTRVTRIEIDWFATRAEALAEETCQIRDLKPLHNAQHGHIKKPRAPTKGGEALKKWMQANSVSECELASALGVPTHQVKPLFGRTARPRGRKAMRIAVITGGHVPTCAWHNWRSDPGLEAWPARATAEYERAVECLTRWGHSIPPCLHKSERRAA